MNARNQLITLLAGLCLAACSSAGMSEDPNDLCDAAQDHLASCLGVGPETLVLDCNPGTADDLLGKTCDEILNGDDKSDLSDWAGDLACKSGIVRFCDYSACDQPMYPGPSETCSDYIPIQGCGGCEFYECREDHAETKCGNVGYYIGFGLKYCERMLQVTYQRMSPEGQVWFDASRNCLMEYIEEHIALDNPDCEGVKQECYKSHPDCYAGLGFCDLPFSDWLLVLGSIDIDDVDFVEVMLTGVQCLDQYRDDIWALFGA